MNVFIVLEMNTFGAGDKHFNVGDERVEIVHANFSHTHTQLPVISKKALFRHNCYSQVLTTTTEWYHALVLMITFE